MKEKLLTMAISEERKSRRSSQNVGLIVVMVLLLTVMRGFLPKTLGGYATMVGLVFVFILSFVVLRSVLVKRGAARHRPAALVIPAYTTGDLVDFVAKAGLSSHKWGGDGGTPIAVSVSDECVELWSGSEDEPRISLPRAEIGSAAVVSGEFGRKFGQPRTMRVIGLRTSIGILKFVPAYRSIRNTFGSTPTGLDRAISELGSMGIGASTRDNRGPATGTTPGR